MRKPQDKVEGSRYTNLSSLIVISMIFLVSSISPGKILSLQQENTLVDSEYRIGGGDLLEISVFELPELNQTVRVSENGSISFSLLGRVDVVGLTAQELEKKLALILDQQYTQVSHVSVFITEYQKVSVLGAIMSPGMYELAGPITLLQIIAQAGGLTAQAMNELFIDRKGEDGEQTRIMIRLEDLLISGNQDFNIKLKPKDIVIIPIDQFENVYVYGEVNAPGVIQYLSSKKITLLQAITQVGGTTEWAKKMGVMIKRIDKKTGKESRIQVNLSAVISGKVLDVVLQDGDVVIVP